jgi:hypothetical protein
MNERQGVFFVALFLSFGAISQAQPTLQPQIESFQLTPVAPPTPAMKYHLLYHQDYQRIPGNAAPLYMDAMLMATPDDLKMAEKALDSYAAGDVTGFDTEVDKIDVHLILRELDLAGRREECDWESPVRQEGSLTLLPHLNNLRTIAMIVKAKALREADQGKIEDALSTFRIGYELSDKTGQEKFLISGLVSIGITNLMNDGLRHVMNRTDTPNLYWALCRFPSRKPIFTREMDSDGIWWLTAPVDLDRIGNGEQLSVEQWQSVFDYIQDMASDKPRLELPTIRHSNPVLTAGPDVLRQARAEYALIHRLSPDAAGQVDPIVVLGECEFRQFDNAWDDLSKFLNLPYPQLLEKSNEYDALARKLKRDQPYNEFLQMLPTIHRAVWTFARADRELAAMTAVEAIRSYAAANDGKLPDKLEDISDTPVPDNPATGLPFEYGVNGDTVTISDTQSEQTLTYTIKIRK